MFERFTNQSRRVVVLAHEEARMLNHNYIGTEHLLLGLLHEGRGSAARVLTAMDVTLGTARDQVVAIVGRGQQQLAGHIPFTPHAKKSLEFSLREALRLGDGYIGTGHLLLGLIRQGDNTAVKMLGGLGTDPNDLRARVTQELRDHPEEGQDAPAVERQQQVKVFLRDTVQGLLGTIEDRLSAIELHLGITRPVAAALRTLDQRIAETGAAGEAVAAAETGAAGEAVAAAETGAAGEAVAAAETGAAGEAVAAGETGEVAGEPDELAWLRSRVARLEDRLREHGIDPREPQEPPAAAG